MRVKNLMENHIKKKNINMIYVMWGYRDKGKRCVLDFFLPLHVCRTVVA